MVAVAIVGAAVVGGAASVASSNKASRTARDAAAQNNALQQDIYQKNTAALSPYVEAGNKATPAIQALLGLGGDPAAQDAAFAKYRDSTGYQFQLGEGQRALTSALGNKGLLDSGAAAKALTKYGQQMGNASFNDYYSKLSGQQQVGLAGASAMAGVGQNYANSVSINNNAAANTVANAALSNANTINGTLSSALGAYALSRGMGSSYGGGGGFSPYTAGYQFGPAG